MPTISAFPACCGASVLTGFNESPDAPAGFKYDPKTFVYLKDEQGRNIQITMAERFADDLEKIRKNAKGGHMYSCILTQAQIDASKGLWMKVLKSNGFDCVRRWTNNAHSDVQFLYLFVLCTDQKGKCGGDFTQPPKGWAELPGPVEEPEPSTFQRLTTMVASKAA